jgi:hypothetical protein
MVGDTAFYTDDMSGTALAFIANFIGQIATTTPGTFTKSNQNDEYFVLYSGESNGEYFTTIIPNRKVIYPSNNRIQEYICRIVFVPDNLDYQNIHIE